MKINKMCGALYVRQSRTAEGSASMDIQFETNRETAKRFDVPIAHELCERPSTSGYRNRGRDRPQFQRLLRLIRAGEVDCVVVYKSDRLSRGGGVGWAPLLEAIETAGHDANRFILTSDGWLSEFELGIRAAIDREESAKISARMLDVRAREARSGKPRVGCRAYGYEYSKVTKQMTIVVSEAETLRECTRRVLDGESVYGIAKDLNARRIPTAAGGRWKTGTLLGVLRSARIAGLRSHLGEIVGKGQWEPIITEDEYHRLLAVTAHRHSHGPKKAARTFPLVGFLICGKCGEPLRSMTSSCKEKQRRRYACRSGELGGCGGIQVRAEFVEDAVRDYVVGVLTHPAMRDQLLAAAPAPGDQVQAGLLAELQRLGVARERLTDLAVAGAITTAEVRRKNTELDAQVDKLERRLADLTTVTTLPQLPISEPELLEAWDQRGIDFQRHLTGLLVESITVAPAKRLAPGKFDRERLTWVLRV